MPVLEATGIIDPIGLWGTPLQTVSFGIQNETAPEAEVPVYRVNFSESDVASSSALDENLDNFERMNAVLNQIPSQLDGLVLRVQSKQHEAASGLSFTLSATDLEMGPESELLALLAVTDLAGVSDTVPEGVSFGLSGAASEVLTQAKEKLETLLEQVNHDVLHFAWIETVISGRLIAHTEVDWRGDSISIWNDTISAELMFLHLRTLEIVSQTRNLNLRLLFTVTGGAAKMAALLTVPGGAVLALPAVYQYVIKILQQVKQLQSA